MRASEFITESVNLDITMPEFYHEQQIGDYTYRAQYRPHGLKITVFDGRKKIGVTELRFAPYDTLSPEELKKVARTNNIWLEPDWTEVNPNYRQQGIMGTMYAYAKMLGNTVRPSWNQSMDARKAWKKLKQAGHAQHLTREGVAEGSEQKMSVQDTLAYLKKVMGTESHEDWRNHIINTNEYFVLKDISVNSLKSDLSGLNKTNVEKYKQMDFSKAPPIVIGSDGNILDGYHRANVAKALKVPTLKAWVGVKKQAVAEKINPKTVVNGFVDTQTIGDYLLKAQGLEAVFSGRPRNLLDITVFDSNTNKEIAWSTFIVQSRDEDNEKYLESMNTKVDPEYRGRGLAKIMYQYANSIGNDIEPSRLQSAMGKDMWKGLSKSVRQLPPLAQPTLPAKKPTVWQRLRKAMT